MEQGRRVGETARLLFCRIVGVAGSAKGVDNGEVRKKTTGLTLFPSEALPLGETATLPLKADVSTDKVSL